MKIFVNALVFAVTFFFIAPCTVHFIRNFTFVIPFSQKMVNYNVYTLAVHKQLVFTDCLSSGVLFLVALVLAICVFLFEGHIEYITLGVSFLLSLIATFKELMATQANIKQFYNRHYICMDSQNFYDFVQDFVSNAKTETEE